MTGRRVRLMVWRSPGSILGVSVPLPSSWGAFPGLSPQVSPISRQEQQLWAGWCLWSEGMTFRVSLASGRDCFVFGQGFASGMVGSRPLKCFYCHLSLSRSCPDKQHRSQDCCPQWGEQTLPWPLLFPSLEAQGGLKQLGFLLFLPQNVLEECHFAATPPFSAALLFPLQ